ATTPARVVPGCCRRRLVRENASVGEVGFCVRAQLRARRVSWALLAIVIGLSAAVVMVAAAGARRTDSAYTRYLAATHAADLLLSPNERGSAQLYADIAKVRGAAAVAPVVGYGVSPVSDLRHPMLVLAAMDDMLGNRVERPLLTEGRLPDPNAGHEMVADRDTGHALGLHPGSTIRVAVAHADEELPNLSRDPVVTLNIVGVGATRDSVVTVNALASEPTLIAGPAFTRQYGAEYRGFDGAYVKLQP